MTKVESLQCKNYERNVAFQNFRVHSLLFFSLGESPEFVLFCYMKSTELCLNFTFFHLSWQWTQVTVLRDRITGLSHKHYTAILQYLYSLLVFWLTITISASLGLGQGCSETDLPNTCLAYFLNNMVLCKIYFPY